MGIKMSHLKEKTGSGDLHVNLYDLWQPFPGSHYALLCETLAQEEVPKLENGCNCPLWLLRSYYSQWGGWNGLSSGLLWLSTAIHEQTHRLTHASVGTCSDTCAKHSQGVRFWGEEVPHQVPSGCTIILRWPLARGNGGPCQHYGDLSLAYLFLKEKMRVGKTPLYRLRNTKSFTRSAISHSRKM